MRGGRKRGEWSDGSARRLTPTVHPVAIALVVGICTFILGFGAAWVFGPRSATESADASGSAQGSVSNAPAPQADVAGAVETRRPGVELEAAPTSGLVVVQVSVTTCGARSFGTGVLIDNDLVVTAAHVVGEAGLVRIDHGGNVLTGEVLGVFADNRDLALIELDASMAIPLPAGAVPAPGHAITAVGYPEGGPQAVVVGPRVEVPPKASAVVWGELLAFEAPAELGMSGGPVLDEQGQLIGILVAIEAESATAIAVAINDPAEVAGTPLVDGRCPASA